MRGVTLIELVVAVFIFSIVVGAAFNLLFAGISIQRIALARELLVDQTSFLAEYMSRALRQAQKSEGAAVCPPDRWNYETNVALDEIKFLGKDGACRRIYLVTSTGYGVIWEEKIGFGADVALTSDDLDVQTLTFSLQGEDQADIPPLQPRVTFSIHAKARGTEQAVFFQTTISQRHFDIQE